MLVMTMALGMLCGFVCSIPLAGPVALLVVQRGLSRGPKAARSILAGAAIAESAYVYLAFWGFSEVLAEGDWLASVSRILGAVVLVVFGARFWQLSGLDPASDSLAIRSRSRSDFAMGFVLIAMNPALLLFWSGVIASLDRFGVVRWEPRAGLAFAFGSSTGMITWFAIVLYAISHGRKVLASESLARSVRVLAVCMITAGVGLLGAAIWSGS